MSLEPVPARERFISLDILRGIALLGVLIGNSASYSGRAFAGEPPNPTALDTVAQYIADIFVESKAQTLLCMLFGFGFAMQLLRAERRGEPVMPVYIRRLLVLFAIGCAHILLLWWGDVTCGYAIGGFGLLLFLRASDRTRLVAAIMLAVVPVVVFHLPGTAERAVAVVISPSEVEAAMDHIVQVINSPSHAHLAWEHARFALIFNAQVVSWYFFWIVGRFLLGYIVGRRRWFERDGADHLPVFRKLLWWGLAAAALGTAQIVLHDLGLLPRVHGSVPLAILYAVLVQLDYFGMAFVYVAGVVLLVQRPRWRRVLGVIAPLGRMPLTTYVSQSLVATFVFYHWGLGWAGSVGAAGCLGFSVALFALQIALSQLWLHYFKFGPLEWVWRWLVYLKRPAMR
ncbi:MAG TPA: DUF418 domain-containing protein [Kofleriaceae bacterium]